MVVVYRERAEPTRGKVEQWSYPDLLRAADGHCEANEGPRREDEI